MSASPTAGGAEDPDVSIHPAQQLTEMGWGGSRVPGLGTAFGSSVSLCPGLLSSAPVWWTEGGPRS